MARTMWIVSGLLLAAWLTPACSSKSGGGGSSGGDGEGGTTGGGGNGGGDSTPLCDTSRPGWCSCYLGPGAEDWWDETAATDSCTGYSCCYTYDRAADTKGCSCTNDYTSASCASSVSSVQGAVVVSSCPAGFSGGSGGSSGTGGSTGSGGGSSCGEPCASGCCSPSGAICCAPPFCGGDCVGSPCC